jgi:hypothetical protein
VPEALSGRATIQNSTNPEFTALPPLQAHCTTRQKTPTHIKSGALIFVETALHNCLLVVEKTKLKA